MVKDLHFIANRISRLSSFLKQNSTTHKIFWQFSPLDLPGRVFGELFDELDSAADELERFESGLDETVFDLLLAQVEIVFPDHHGRNQFLTLNI